MWPVYVSPEFESTARSVLNLRMTFWNTFFIIINYCLSMEILDTIHTINPHFNCFAYTSIPTQADEVQIHTCVLYTLICMHVEGTPSVPIAMHLPVKVFLC